MAKAKKDEKKKEKYVRPTYTDKKGAWINEPDVHNKKTAKLEKSDKLFRPTRADYKGGGAAGRVDYCNDMAAYFTQLAKWTDTRKGPKATALRRHKKLQARYEEIKKELAEIEKAGL